MRESKGLKVLVYGDEAIDVHLLVDNETPESILNDRLNGQDIKMFTDRTGHMLVGDLISEINKSLFDDLAIGDKIKDIEIEHLCSCSQRANYAYYIWKKDTENSNRALYYKDKFIGAKFDWLQEQDKRWLSQNSEEFKDIEDVNILVFYDRHYNSDVKDCSGCEDLSQITSEKEICGRNELISSLLKNYQSGKEPIIFIRTAGELDAGSDNRTLRETIKIINNSNELRRSTIVLTKLNDLKELGTRLPVAYSWEDLIRNTYKELNQIRIDKESATQKGIVSAAVYIVDFNYDGYAIFDFTEESHSCTVVYNRNQINGDGFKRLSERGSVPSSTSILQAIVTNFMIKDIMKNGTDAKSYNSLLVQKSLKEFNDEMPLILKICYLSIYHYCKAGRMLHMEAYRKDSKRMGDRKVAFCMDKTALVSFIQKAYEICKAEEGAGDFDKQERLPSKTEDKRDENAKFIKRYMPASIKLDRQFLIGTENFTDVLMKRNRSNIIKVCQSIVEDGLSKIEIPYISFGNLISIDRKEIVSYRWIHNLMNNKLNAPNQNKKPLSFCVFGKPGSGKSFGVKEISNDILGNKNKILEFNLSQMNTIDDLCNAFVKISDIILTGKIPVVFWDEFDSTFNGKRYGWLKYFLAPMEDGKYFANNVMHNVGNCIFVFAGSNSESWEDFTKMHKSKTADDANSDFSKITDFISRISGYIDVLGPNKGKDDESYMLRRAVFIRKNIERYYNIGEKHFTMDKDVLQALLTVSEYKHGNRSLSKLIEQFRINSGSHKEIKKYCVPNQLDLYVDEEEFNKIVNSASEKNQN